MKHYNVTLDGVMAAVNGMNTHSSGGTLYEYGNEYLIRGQVSTSNIEELGKNPIIAEGGNVVLLEQIATITIGGERPQTGLASNRGINRNQTAKHRNHCPYRANIGAIGKDKEYITCRH